MAMVRGALRSQTFWRSARSGTQLRVPIDHLLARPCSTSMLVGYRRLPATSDAWMRLSRRSFAQASANKAADSSDQRLEKEAEELADAAVADKEDPDAKLRQEVDALQSEVRERRHKVLLALADYENDKKKLAKERDARHRRAIVGFATRMVDVYGMFDTKLPATSDAACDSQAPLEEGIGLVRQAFASTLGRFDVKPLSISSGEQFIVARHESIGTVIGSDHADGMVAEMVKPGWILQPGNGAPAVLARVQVKVASSGHGAPSFS